MRNPVIAFAVLIFSIILMSGCTGDNGQQNNGTGITGPSVTLNAPDELPDATVGVEYSYSFCKPDLEGTSELCDSSATNPMGGNPPYSFMLGSGVGFPPFGLSLNLNGILGGTPTADGIYTFEVCAKDLNGYNDCKTVDLTVNPAETGDNGNNGNNGGDDGNEPWGEVTIDSAVCEYTYTDSYGDRRYKITASGTASGSAGSELQLTFNPGYAPDATCDSWGPSEFQTCARGDGPETTAWSLTVPDSEIYEGTTLTMVDYTINLQVRIFIGDGETADEVFPLVCPH